MSLKKEKALLLAEGDLLRHLARREIDSMRSAAMWLQLASSAISIGLRVWRTFAHRGARS